MSAWWQRLAPRERWILGGAAGLLLALGLYLLVWEPWQDSLERLRGTVAARRADVAWMRQAAADLQRLQSAGEAPQATARGGRSLLTVVDQSARSAGLSQAVKRVEPQGGDKVRVWLEQAGFDEMIRWVNVLEREQGVRVDSAVVERHADAGRVDARLVLREAAP